jgi:Vps52 / Sac2 family
MLFRSVHFALVDNACREYLFLSELFMVEGQNAQVPRTILLQWAPKV